MFTQELTTIPVFTDSDSEELFDQILDLNLNRACDSTILAVMRALLYPRIENTDLTYRYYESICFDTNFVNTSGNMLGIFPCARPPKDVFSEDWKELFDVAEYLKRHCDKTVTVYINEEESTAFIFCADLDNKTRHVLSAMIPRFFAKLFREIPLTELEHDMINSLVLYYPGQFQQKIAEVANTLDVMRKLNAIKVRGFTKMYYKSMLSNYENTWREAKRSLEAAFNAYENAVTVRDNALLQYEGAKAAAEAKAEDNELYEFLTHHNNVNIIECASNHLKIVIDNYIDVFDADGFEGFGDRFYNQFNLDDFKIFDTMDDLKLFTHALFSTDPKIHIRTCGYYDLHLGGGVKTAAHYNYMKPDRIPNPHLQYHACLGQYAPLIQQKLADGDLMGTILQCNGSVMSVNVHEASATFLPFLEEVFKSTDKIIEDFNHVQMTPREALEWLKSQEAAE
jgi:hypothetical protein